MIKVTSVEVDEKFVINEDYIVALIDVSDGDAEENTLLSLDGPDRLKSYMTVTETIDELYYEINRS